MVDDQYRLERILELSEQLVQINDLDVLLERILAQARQFVNADAGSIYVRDGNDLKFSYAQNDTLRSRLAPGKKLIYTTFSLPINNDSIAGYVANTGELLNISDAYELSSCVPYRFGRKFDEISCYRTTSMLTVPLCTSRGVIVGVLQVINAMDANGCVAPFSRDDERIICHFATSAAVALERAQMTRALILRMISMAELRDPKETGAHVNRVGAYALEIYENWAKNHGINDEEIERQRDILRMAAMLHDVGKVAISDAILKKPGRYTPDEFEIMKQHTLLGSRLFINPSSAFDEAAAEVALNHHENWDGTGYPGVLDHAGRAVRGKRGEEIPLFGRIVALADVYDALRSKRVYKDAMDEQSVLDTIEQEAGKKFDPEIVQAFYESLDVLRAIADRYPEAMPEAAPAYAGTDHAHS